MWAKDKAFNLKKLWKLFIYMYKTPQFYEK